MYAKTPTVIHAVTRCTSHVCRLLNGMLAIRMGRNLDIILAAATMAQRISQLPCGLGARAKYRPLNTVAGGGVEGMMGPADSCSALPELWYRWERALSSLRRAMPADGVSIGSYISKLKQWHNNYVLTREEVVPKE